MISTLNSFLLFLLLTAVLSRNLQTVYQVIIIGAGSSGVGASVSLAEKNVQHIILEARNRFGGRTYATTVSGVPVDLGASFVHYPGSSNAIDTYVKKLGWGSTAANMNIAEVMYQTGLAPSSADETTATNIVKEFQTYVSNQVSGGTDIDLKTAWDNYKTSVTGSGYSTAALDRAYFDVILQAVLNGADITTVSGKNYVAGSAKSTGDYLPATSYAALIQSIYKTFCKNAPIIYNQVVRNIDYSGSTIKITTVGGQIYYAKKVINTIPLGVLKSGSVTFTPSLPAAYQTAISSIGMGIFNKVIVTLNDTFWPSPEVTRVVNLVIPTSQTAEFIQVYIAPSDPKLLLFFVAGNTSATLNQQNDAQIIAYLQTIIAKYSSTSLSVTGFSITRWEQDPYALGSYSYYKVGTTVSHFQTLSTGIDNKLWFAGEHVPTTFSSNVHGAFQSGLTAGKAAWQMWSVLCAVWILALLLTA